MADAGVEVGRISIKVTPDTDGFRSQLKRELEALEKTLKGDIEVNSHLNTGQARADFQRLISQMKAQGAKGVQVKADVVVDKSMLDRLKLASAGAGGGGFRGGGAGLGGFADTLAVAAAAAAFAAPALALVSGALVSLPAIAAGVITPIAAIALGLDGIKAAASQLTPEVDHLKQVMSDAFEGRLTPVFGQLREIFPALERSLPTVANGISDVVGSLVDMATSPEGMAKIEGTISNIGEAISRSAPGVASFADSLITLAEKVSAKFPGLADTFNSWGESFGGWIDQITKVDPSTGVSQLDTAMSNFGGTIGEILGLVKDLGKQGFEWLSDPQFGDKMKGFVEDVRSLVNDVLPGLKDFFVDVADAIKGIADSVEKVKEAGNNLPDFIKNEVPTEQEKQESGGNPFTSPNAPWRDTLEQLKAGWAVFKAQVAGIWDGIKNGANTAWQQVLAGWNNLKTGVSTGAAMISQQLTGIWSGITTAASSAWNGVVGAVQGAVSSIQGAVSGVASRISGVWNGIVAAAQSAWNGVVSAVQDAWSSIVSAVQFGIESVVSFVAGMGPRIVGAITSIDLAGAGRALMEGLLRGIREGAQAVYDFVSGIAKRIAELKGPLPYDRKVLIPNGEALMEGLQTGIESGVGPVLDRASSLAEEIANAINTGLEGVDTEGLHDRLKQAMDELDLESKRLKVDLNGVPKENKDGREAIKGQREQLQTIRDQLSYQKEQLGMSDSQNSSLKDRKSIYEELGEKMFKGPLDMIEAGVGGAGQQFLSDLGIGGEGALSQALQQGLGFAKQFVFNVGSMDDALAGQKNIQNKEALQYYRR